MWLKKRNSRSLAGDSSLQRVVQPLNPPAAALAELVVTFAVGLDNKLSYQHAMF